MLRTRFAHLGEEQAEQVKGPKEQTEWISFICPSRSPVHLPLGARVLGCWPIAAEPSAQFRKQKDWQEVGRQRVRLPFTPLFSSSPSRFQGLTSPKVKGPLHSPPHLQIWLIPSCICSIRPSSLRKGISLYPARMFVTSLCIKPSHDYWIWVCHPFLPGPWLIHFLY